ncbi:HNH endonuclease [Clostridium sp. NSJ-6]|uniref:HNH endonuclease n=1 Tax=Clostridium hominis TaxID=2763036 RepID=A0ABR7DDK3_9CLOT|nr:HNH endonuclease signature motif containing protein [Clostridium hominis]MBC5629479.1 HNH endonuclease [Clostridium hominis]
MVSELNDLLTRNNIKIENFEVVVYQYFILSVFEDLTLYLRKGNNKKAFRKILRNSTDKDLEVRKIVGRITGLDLNDKEIARILELILAFYNKRDTREGVSKETKVLLLESQRYKCKICGEHINLKNSHYDHIVPWSLVGDELKDNYQMLCEGCNLRKKNSIIFGVKEFFKNRNKVM